MASLPPQPYLPNNIKSNKNTQDTIDEYNRIKQQIEAITATEAKIKSEQFAQAPPPAQNNSSFVDQSKVPAAMRTSLLFGVSSYKYI